MAARMFEHMSAETALALLREPCAPPAASKPGTGKTTPSREARDKVLRLNAETGDIGYDRYSTFEEALASIREAADWYGLVGTLGYGVYAWF